MRLLFAGTPDVAVTVLDELLGSAHDVVAVLTRPDARSGRGRSLAPSPVKLRALEAGLEVLTPRSARDPELRSRLLDLDLDCAPVVAYGALLPPELLSVPRHGWVNLHFSTLPAWRGAAPVQHAVLAGDEVTGATTFQIEAGLDTGPVFGMLTETIRPRDTSGDLLDRLARAGAGLMVATLDAISDGVAAPVPQSSDGISYAPRLEVADGRVRWTHPAYAVDRRVRGCTPAPGPWTTAPDGSRLKLAPVLLRPDVTDLAPGQLQATKDVVLVGTGSHAVALTEVSPEGRRAMEATAWARGARLSEDAVLGTEPAEARR